MSGEKLNEKDSEKNASSDRPNPFAINVGNLLTGTVMKPILIQLCLDTHY